MPLFGSGKNNHPVDAGESPESRFYADRLAFIGRQLDGSRSRSVVIAEVSGSFIVRATDTRSGELRLMEVVEEDFVQSGGSSSFFAGQASADSYEALLGAVGTGLDSRVAANVGIVERRDQIQVVGWMHGEAAGRPTYVSFHHAYPVTDLNRAAEGQR